MLVVVACQRVQWVLKHKLIEIYAILLGIKFKNSPDVASIANDLPSKSEVMRIKKYLKRYLKSLWDFRELLMGDCDGFELNDRRERASQYIFVLVISQNAN